MLEQTGLKPAGVIAANYSLWVAIRVRVQHCASQLWENMFAIYFQSSAVKALVYSQYCMNNGDKKIIPPFNPRPLPNQKSKGTQFLRKKSITKKNKYLLT